MLTGRLGVFGERFAASRRTGGGKRTDVHESNSLPRYGLRQVLRGAPITGVVIGRPQRLGHTSRVNDDPHAVESFFNPVAARQVAIGEVNCGEKPAGAALPD